MSWKKHFTAYGSQGTDTMKPSSASRFQSWLPEVYSGQPNRVERYTQYDQMDMDSEISTDDDMLTITTVHGHYYYRILLWAALGRPVE